MNIFEVKEVKNLFTLVIDPVVQFLFAAAAFYFVYGVFKFIQNKAAGESADIKEGANHVLWGTVGLFIMISVWGIIAVLKRTVGQ
jgi:hypothetical protein